MACLFAAFSNFLGTSLFRPLTNKTTVLARASRRQRRFVWLKKQGLPLPNCKLMNLSKKAKLIIYRFREKGLEVFLVNADDEGGENWEIPESEVDGQKSQTLIEEERLIELDPVAQESGDLEEALAVEGDWHEIPSLKGMLFEDAQALKNKLKEMDQGTFFNVKEAFKKVLPHQYNFLKELKDILVDRNSVKDL